MITPAQRKWIRAVHVAKKELGLSDEIYETVLYSAAGITSSRDIKNWQQFDTVMNAFKAMGFSYRRPSGSAGGTACVRSRVRDCAHITERQEYYIRGLWKLASRNKDEKSLRAIVQRIGGVDDISFLPRKKAAAVIQALRDISAKAGFNPDGPEGA